MDTTDNSFLKIRSKFENIFNHDEIAKNSRKKLIISQLLARKIVMNVGDWNTRNLYTKEYQGIDDEHDLCNYIYQPQRIVEEFEAQRSLYMI